MKYKFNIKNLDCVNCAREVEKSLNEDEIGLLSMFEYIIFCSGFY